jgi:hypothetical protein
MADDINSVDPFKAAAVSRLAADERAFKASVIKEIQDLKTLVHNLVSKLESKTK